MDDELSPRARLLVDAAMEADVPPPAIADGSWEIVVSRLTIEAESADAPAASAAEPPRARARWIVAVVVGMVLAATAALGWILSRPRPVIDAKQPPVPAKTTAPATPPAAPPAQLPAPAMDAAAVAKLLDDAELAAPEVALELLARHAELSPLGPDGERRMALRITTLCALGRVDDAKADAVAFLSRPREAKWTTKVRESCAGR